MALDKAKSKFPEVFIISSGRAGSTLLQSILNASQQIHVPQESDFIARAYPFFYSKNSYALADYAQLAAIFCSTSQSNGWGMSQQHIFQYLKEKQPQTLAASFSAICEAYHLEAGTQHLKWGIKRPVLIASIREIRTVYPQAKLIHICRDGRDVYLSYKAVHEKSQVKFGPKGVAANALYWVDGLRRVKQDKQKQSVDEQPVYEVRYEDLLNNTETTVRQLCDHIGIDFSPGMLENHNAFSKKRKVAPGNLMKSIHSKIGKGIDSSNSKKYLRQMTRVQIFLYELIAAPYLQAYDYSLEFPWLNSHLLIPFRWLAYAIGRRINDSRYSKRDRRAFQGSIETSRNLLKRERERFFQSEYFSEASNHLVGDTGIALFRKE